MYEGTWEVSNDDSRNPDGILGDAFGLEHSDDIGNFATRKGRVRNYIDRRLFTANSIDRFFPTTPRHNSDSQAHLIEKEKIGFKTALTGKIILFDGDYREKEIDLFFAINPLNIVSPSKLEYNQFLPNGEVYH